MARMSTRDIPASLAYLVTTMVAVPCGHSGTRCPWVRDSPVAAPPARVELML
jgi:hypothetical protein